MLAVAAWLVTSTLLAGLLWFAFRNVQQLNRTLAQRNESLHRANEELAMAARTSAIGAVSAHLMHGLKNPLASLTQFVRSGSSNGDHPASDEWTDALAASRRMHALVEQTLEVVADASGEPIYEIGVEELIQGVRRRMAEFAEASNVRLSLNVECADKISSKTANLVSLILVNLVENAIQASLDGAEVLLAATHTDDCVTFSIQDAGPGFPAHLRSRLFLPCKSTREGGSGIGLTICKQLADHLKARLELVEPSFGGCRFILTVPSTSLLPEANPDRA
jgi:signal transduction histidine kinase